MPDTTLLRNDEAMHCNIEIREDLNQPWIFDWSYWWLKRRRFKLTLKFAAGIFFRPEKSTVITLSDNQGQEDTVTFAIVVHGTRTIEPSTIALQLDSDVEARLPPNIVTVGIRLLTENADKSTWVQINK